MTRQAVATVGKFSWDGQTITGPRDYMEDPGGFPKVKADLESGRNAIIGAAPIGTDTVTLMLVAIQTNYAGWKGTRDLLRFNERSV